MVNRFLTPTLTAKANAKKVRILLGNVIKAIDPKRYHAQLKMDIF